MDAPFQDTATTADLTRLQKLLRQSLQNSPISLPHDKDLQLLNLACGRADETAVLAETFDNTPLHITGLDIRDRELDLARQRWQKHLPPHATAEFHTQDGSRLHHSTQLSKAFDVVFMRHQNFWNGDTTWTQIYDNALHRLDQDGVMIITSYFDREHRQALNALTSLGAELITSMRNPESRIIPDAPHKSVDRHIALLRKPS